MVLKVNSDHAREIEQAVKDNDGYCPCAIMKLPKNKCMCEDFREKVKDPNWKGECHCGLFKKV